MGTVSRAEYGARHCERLDRTSPPWRGDARIHANPGLPVGDVSAIATNVWQDYIPCMQFEKIWVEQCRATKAIKRRFGAKSALDYLIGEKLTTFADAAREDPAFAKELPRFLAAVWRLFNA